MQNAPTVYITNRSPTHDYSPAARHGAIRFVTAGNYPVFKTERLQEEIIEALIHSTPDDFLMPSGSSLIAALCMVIWLEMHGRVKVLLYDRGQDSYVLRVFDRKALRLAIESASDRLKGRSGRMVRPDTAKS